MAIEIDWQAYPPKQGDENQELRYYPRIKNSRKVTDDELFNEASKKSVITRSHFYPALYEVARAIAQELMNGNIVTLNDLGTFKLQIGTDTPVSKNERMNLRNISIKGINFAPSPDFLEFLADPQFEWKPERVSTPTYTDDAILLELQSWFTTHSLITRQEFCHLFQMSRTTGTTRLNNLIEKGLIEKQGENKETRYVLKSGKSIKLTEDDFSAEIN